MKISIEKWKNFKLPSFVDYGMPWPAKTPQLIKELKVLHGVRMGLIKLEPKKKQKVIFNCCINGLRLLFPNVEIYKDTPYGRVYNNYLLDIVDTLSYLEDSVIAGPASANKTYITASIMMLHWVSKPDETMVLCSTTSSSAAERRIWGAIKELHRSAKWEDNGLFKIGEIVEQKSIVFDPGKALDSKALNDRDFRQSMMIVPIATDSTGDSALETIQGAKQKSVFWVCDEQPHMNPGVTRPNGNLRTNPFYQFIGIGNSDNEFDEHGKDCMPVGGLKALNIERDRTWISKKGRRVLFLHGEESPNYNPIITDNINITTKQDLPFPYTSNQISAIENAREYGDGDIEAGKQTADYWKFNIGWWAPTNAKNSIFSHALFSQYKADLPFDGDGAHLLSVASSDYGFTSGGDSNTYQSAKVYRKSNGKIEADIGKQVDIYAKATEKMEYIRSIAGGFAEKIIADGITPNNYGGDTGNDAALMFQEIGKILKTHELVGISSVGPSPIKKYGNLVTWMWIQARTLVKTGCLRGIDPGSNMVIEASMRGYTSGRGLITLIPKKEMVKTIGKSPDHADAFVYLCHMLIRTGLFDEEMSKVVDNEEDAADLERTEQEEAAAAKRRESRDYYRRREKEADLYQMASFSHDEYDMD